jgi:hypothetical protein
MTRTSLRAQAAATVAAAGAPSVRETPGGPDDLHGVASLRREAQTDDAQARSSPGNGTDEGELHARVIGARTRWL